MNFTLVKVAGVPASRRPLQYQRLERCLVILGVKKRKSRLTYQIGYRASAASDGQLWNWLEEAKRNHRRLILLHHPDRGGCHERAALVNAAWRRVRELLARRGVAYN